MTRDGEKHPIKEGQQESDSRVRRLLTLFLYTVYISSFTFGGGFVIVHFMRRIFVQRLKWLGEEEMLDLISLAQSAPGAVAINSAMLLGWRVGRLPGVLLAVTGMVLPPFLIMALVSMAYEAFAANPIVAMVLQGTQAAVAAIILDVAWQLGRTVAKERCGLDLLVFLITFGGAFLLEVNAVYLLLIALLIGLGRALYARREKTS